MSWTTIEKTPGIHGRVAATGVAVALNSVGKDKRPALIIRLGRNVIDTLGLKAAPRVSVQVGDGEKAGMLRIAPDPRGFAVTRHRSAKSGHVSICKFPDNWLNVTHPSEECRYDVIDGAVIVTLPTWLTSPNGSDRRMPVFQGINERPGVG